MSSRINTNTEPERVKLADEGQSHEAAYYEIKNIEAGLSPEELDRTRITVFRNILNRLDVEDLDIPTHLRKMLKPNLSDEEVKDILDSAVAVNVSLLSCVYQQLSEIVITSDGSFEPVDIKNILKLVE